MFAFWLVVIYLIAVVFCGLFVIRLHNSNNFGRESFLLVNGGGWALMGLLEVYALLGHLPHLRWPYAFLFVFLLGSVAKLWDET